MCAWCRRAKSHRKRNPDFAASLGTYWSKLRLHRTNKFPNLLQKPDCGYGIKNAGRVHPSGRFRPNENSALRRIAALAEKRGLSLFPIRPLETCAQIRNTRRPHRIVGQLWKCGSFARGEASMLYHGIIHHTGLQSAEILRVARERRWIARCGATRHVRNVPTEEKRRDGVCRRAHHASKSDFTFILPRPPPRAPPGKGCRVRMVFRIRFRRRAGNGAQPPTKQEACGQLRQETKPRIHIRIHRRPLSGVRSLFRARTKHETPCQS